jgi:putative redox protein
MGITANARDWFFDYCECNVEKIMASDPRRISQINLTMSLNSKWNEKQRKIIEAAAKTCPVAFSLHPEIKVELYFNYITQ